MSKQCLCCEKNISEKQPRICPVCAHVFQGNGWDGIDAHWRAHHDQLMPYGEFWSGPVHFKRDPCA